MKSKTLKTGRESLGGVAYDRLREAIHAGSFQPGKRLREGEVADWLGMSRTPVREALRRLETEGLITHEPHRGVVIAQLDHQMIVELYFMRDVLEGTAARLAARHASDAEISALSDMVSAEIKHVGDPQKLAQANRRFHQVIYHSAHNRFLLKSLNALDDAMALLGKTTLANPGRAEIAHQEHREIVKAIAERNSAAAEEAAKAHIRAALRERLSLMFE
jgi:DNA-binding GntR family transcriptional regulator